MLELKLALFLQLLIGHALADFALQSDAMAKGKNRHNKSVPPLGQKYVPCWTYWLTAHALIHGGVVWLVTDSLSLAVFEIVFHWVVDFLKCENLTNPHVDQIFHLGSKLYYCNVLLPM